jgi:hypothetical protein
MCTSDVENDAASGQLHAQEAVKKIVDTITVDDPKSSALDESIKAKISAEQVSEQPEAVFP